MLNVKRIISGGQVGADRGGLDFAIAFHIPHGGKCPLGRIALDGRIPERYQLEECSSPNYRVRTKLNVRESDATVIFSPRPVGPGSRLTMTACSEFGKPYLWIDEDSEADYAAGRLIDFLEHYGVETLNVAGSRNESSYLAAMTVLKQALTRASNKHFGS